MHGAAGSAILILPSAGARRLLPVRATRAWSTRCAVRTSVKMGDIMSIVTSDRVVDEIADTAASKARGALKRTAAIGAFLTVTIAGVSWAQTQNAAPAATAAAADTIRLLQAPPTIEQVNDINAAASVNMTPDQIGQLVAAAVLAHPTFATSIV